MPSPLIDRCPCSAVCSDVRSLGARMANFADAAAEPQQCLEPAARSDDVLSQQRRRLPDDAETQVAARSPTPPSSEATAPTSAPTTTAASRSTQQATSTWPDRQRPPTSQAKAPRHLWRPDVADAFVTKLATQMARTVRRAKSRRSYSSDHARPEEFCVLRRLGARANSASVRRNAARVDRQAIVPFGSSKRRQRLFANLVLVADAGDRDARGECTVVSTTEATRGGHRWRRR